MSTKRMIVTLTATQYEWLKAKAGPLKSMASVVRELVDRERDKTPSPD